MGYDLEGEDCHYNGSDALEESYPYVWRTRQGSPNMVEPWRLGIKGIRDQQLVFWKENVRPRVI